MCEARQLPACATTRVRLYNARSNGNVLWRTVIGTTFDTLSAAEALEAAGIEEAHAKAIAVAIRGGQGDLATKADINELRTEVASVRSELASVRSELATIRWVVGIQSAVMLATFAIVAAKLL